MPRAGVQPAEPLQRRMGRVEGVVHGLANHVVQLVVCHALGEDCVGASGRSRQERTARMGAVLAHVITAVNHRSCSR